VAKFDFQYAAGPGQIMLRAQADPGHFDGGRNALGPFLRLQLQENGREMTPKAVRTALSHSEIMASHMPSEKGARDGCDLVGRLVVREVAGVQNVNLGVGTVVTICVRAR
jgi:hypothetical protein